MLLGIILIVLGVVGGLSEFIPERFRRGYRLLVATLAVACGVVNLAAQQHGSGQLLAKIDRYGTALSWQRAEAALKVEGPENKRHAEYSLSVKIIPRDHERVRHLNLQLRKGHASVEPDYIDDTSARWLFWIMQDQTGTVDVDRERASGIDTYYFFGRFDEKDNLVKLHADPALYLPSLYASLRDLEDKYVVMRIVSAGVDHPLFTEVRLTFESPSGMQMLAMLPTQLQWTPGSSGSRTLVNSPERYIGGIVSAGHFLSVAR